ncbi:uncharacterized protein LOC124808692 [Hydra vulgaris]|uniref:uncharacterized protein LOC124808692 n=1 Tax=Hydra vulgaris TaxID=6087 RepID=UPI001F5F1557|nr:uncharacterized protein LOC124808692 [Hydra vulgaris]
MILFHSLMMLAAVGVVISSNTTHIRRALAKKEAENLNTLIDVPSTLLVGKSAYKVLELIGAKISVKPFQCITSAIIQIETSSPASVKMCTRSWSAEWHKNSLQGGKSKSGFQYKYDILQINNNPLKWVSFEYLGNVCINYLAFSCGPSTVEGIDKKGVNFIIGSNVLEKWYTWNTNKNLHGIRRCGNENKGVRLDAGVEVSFTIKSEAFYCKESDQLCIANNAFFDNGFTNCL